MLRGCDILERYCIHIPLVPQMQERTEAERRAIWPCLNVATWPCHTYNKYANLFKSIQLNTY